jgi:hypothetical protein
MSDTGIHYPGTAVNETASSPDYHYWYFAERITTPDYDGAFTSDFYSTSTQWLVATNFGFHIPTGSTINGIKVEVCRRGTVSVAPSYRYLDNQVKIVKSDGTKGSANKGDAYTYYSITDYEIATYGGPSDLWDEVWTVDDIDNPNTGVAFMAEIWSTIEGESSGYQVKVIWIRMTVYYTIPESLIQIVVKT